jgi:hypothetical protein
VSTSDHSGSAPSRLRALKEDGATQEPAIEPWMREVRRLCSALGAASTANWGGPISLLNTGVLRSGSARLVWRASCPSAAVEAETANGAMVALTRQLTRQLDERIKGQKAELQQLQNARRGGLKILGEGE